MFAKYNLYIYSSYILASFLLLSLPFYSLFKNKFIIKKIKQIQAFKLDELSEKFE